MVASQGMHNLNDAISEFFHDVLVRACHLHLNRDVIDIDRNRNRRVDDHCNIDKVNEDNPHSHRCHSGAHSETFDGHYFDRKSAPNPGHSRELVGADGQPQHPQWVRPSSE